MVGDVIRFSGPSDGLRLEMSSHSAIQTCRPKAHKSSGVREKLQGPHQHRPTVSIDGGHHASE